MTALFWLILQALFISSVRSIHDLAKGCGANGKQCIGRPHDCLLTPKTCEQLAAVTTLSSTTVHVEIRARGPLVRNRWVGLGFSEDENMGRDPVVNCIQNGTFTEFLLTYNPDHTNIRDGISQLPIHPTEATLEDDGLHCVADLDKKFLVQEQEVDLSASHNFLFSTGPLKAGRVTKHDKVPIISTDAYSF